MFILHSSNKTENLVEHLCAVLNSAPLESPFAKEIFLIQSQGMERWLSQQLANRFQVWANFQFLFPGSFFSFVAQKIGVSDDDGSFDRGYLLWRLEASMRSMDEPVFEPLHRYLGNTNVALKRFQLARELAQIFDQYQVMRPDMLESWRQGRLTFDNPTEKWQQALWESLCAQVGHRHRGAIWLEMIDKLNTIPPGKLSGQLPERVSIFGVNAMPPLFLRFLASLARHCDVHLYLLNPAQTYWADLARKPVKTDEKQDSVHPLLASLGQQGREFQAMLLEIAQFDFEPESFENVEHPNNLQKIQNDILNNSLSSQFLDKDGSISFHACHSRHREVEVLRDQLLSALESDPALALRDIAVMAPDITQYEPHIAAVFHDIQHSVADRTLRLENPTLDIFIRFMELTQSRLGWQSVLDLLQRPAIANRFGLSESDLELVAFWIKETHVRWGQSAQHKKELGLPELNQHTWQAAMERLLLGYAINHEDRLVDGILPYPGVEGSPALALGGLHDFLKLLFAAKDDFKFAKPLKAWGERLTYYADQFFGEIAPDSAIGERQQLNELLMDLSVNLAEIHQEPVEIIVIQQWLQGMMKERKSANGFLRGQLTFCSMLPMRSIPFKVIALLGLNEGEFPKIDRRPTFDLMHQDYRLGDRSHRADDRYQFLEILLSARQQLIVIYIGQSQSSNEIIPPSVAVSELLDVLKDNYGIRDPITLHPLQAFSRRYFDGSSDLFSYSRHHCEIAKSLSTPAPEPQPWWQGSVSVDDFESDNTIELADVLQFFQHPQRHFFRKRMNLRLVGIAAETQEREPFSTKDLPLYFLQQDWISRILAGKDIEPERVQAQGNWLPGSAGVVELSAQKDELSAFASRIQAIEAGDALPDLTVDIEIGPYRIIGNLADQYEGGQLLFRYANLKGVDFICAWLRHLVAGKINPQKTFLISKDDNLVFPDNYGNERDLLALLEWYIQGQQRPDAFFTEPALAYLQQATKPNGQKPPYECALECFKKSIESDWEYELRKLYGQAPDLRDILPESLTHQYDRLLLPAWNVAHG